jgi:hypothetical protein
MAPTVACSKLRAPVAVAAALSLVTFNYLPCAPLQFSSTLDADSEIRYTSGRIMP